MGFERHGLVNVMKSLLEANTLKFDSIWKNQSAKSYCYGGCPLDVKFLEGTSKQFGAHSKQLRRI